MGLIEIIEDYWKLLQLFEQNFIMFIIQINLDYWFAVLLLHIIVIIACIVIIGFYILVLLAHITCLCQIYYVHGLT